MITRTTFVFLVGLCLILVSCQDVSNVSNPTQPGETKRATIISLYGRQLDSIGIYHNIGCDTAELTNFSDATNWQDSVTLITRRGMAGLKNLLNWDTTGTITPEQTDSIATVGSVAFPGGTTPFADLRLRVSGYTGWAALVTNQDKAIVDSVHLFIANYSTAGKTLSHVYNDIVDKANSLITYYNTLSWSGPGAGELAAGVIQTLKQSAIHWDAESSHLQPGDPRLEIPQALTIVQIDAAGYLWGWAEAVFIEQRDNGGKLCICNQWKRIDAGVRRAMAVSFFKWWK